MQYDEFKPNEALTRYVECYWYAYSDKPPFRERESLIPDGTIELMFNFGDSYAQVKGDTKKLIKGSHIIGIRKQSLTISQTSRQHFFSIRFRPGGHYPFFRLPVHLFSNDFYPLRDIFGKELDELEERLADAKTNQSRVSITDQFLLKKAEVENDDSRFIERCLPDLLQGGDVMATAHAFNTNYKALERKFYKVIGLSPSHVLKIHRFNRAVLGMYSGKFRSLTEIGYAAGYYDQAHFIREFRHLTQFTPKEFLREQFTIVKVIQPAMVERLSKLYNF